jgi:hypothetical protein
VKKNTPRGAWQIGSAAAGQHGVIVGVILRTYRFTLRVIKYMWTYGMYCPSGHGPQVVADRIHVETGDSTGIYHRCMSCVAGPAAAVVLLSFHRIPPGNERCAPPMHALRTHSTLLCCGTRNREHACSTCYAMQAIETMDRYTVKWLANASSASSACIQ